MGGVFLYIVTGGLCAGVGLALLAPEMIIITGCFALAAALLLASFRFGRPTLLASVLLASPALGVLPAFAADVLLKWILLVVAVIASIPFGALTVSQFSSWFLAGIYTSRSPGSRCRGTEPTPYNYVA